MQMLSAYSVAIALKTKKIHLVSFQVVLLDALYLFDDLSELTFIFPDKPQEMMCVFGSQ